MSDLAFASLIYGWYSGLVYFTPVLGGLIADRWLGTRATVVLGALLMSAGHLAMSLDQSFLLALAAADPRLGLPQGQYLGAGRPALPEGRGDPPDRGFTIFSTAINIGAVLGPLAAARTPPSMAGMRASRLPAALMIVALFIYLSGQRHLRGRCRRRRLANTLPPLTSVEQRRTALLISSSRLTVLPAHRLPDDLERRPHLDRRQRQPGKPVRHRPRASGSTRSTVSPASRSCRRWSPYGRGRRGAAASRATSPRSASGRL